MAELFDFRGGLYEKGHSVATAVSMSSGKTIQEVVRDVVDKWADERIHESTLIQRLIRDKGFAAEDGGKGSE